MGESSLKARHQAWFETLIERGSDIALDAWFSPAHRLHQNLVPPFPNGIGGIQAALDVLRNSFPNINVQIRQQVEAGDMVLTQFDAQARQLGPLGVVSATGTWVPFHGMLMTRFSDERALVSWLEIDAFEALAHMRALAPLGSLPPIEEDAQP